MCIYIYTDVGMCIYIYMYTYSNCLDIDVSYAYLFLDSHCLFSLVMEANRYIPGLHMMQAAREP